MKTTLGSRVSFKFAGEAVEQRATEGKHAEVAFESGIAKEGFFR
jgi:hypothetical protein